MTWLASLFDTTSFTPHGICLLWDPWLVWMHVASDALIAVAYFSIPFALSLFVARRPDVEFGWVFWAFAIFILACGFTHVFSIVTLWLPIYQLEGITKMVTAAASLATAALLWPLLPKLLAIPSPAQLRVARQELQLQTAQRREAEEMLRQSQKMEAIGQLTGGVAHDFNNILTVIQGNLELAEREIGLWRDGTQQKLTRLVGNASKGVERAATLTRRLLAFARRQPLAPRPVRLDQLLAGMAPFFRSTVGETIEIAVDSAPALWPVEVDPGQFESAILNLVINARDAMPQGGRLAIATANVVLEATGDGGAGEHVEVTVTDTGHGMDAVALSRAFEPFYTTKQAGHGTGLGLSQVYGFVKQSNGQIRIDSTPGAGTTVRICFPRFAGGVAAAPEAVAPVAPLRGRPGETILVVEDDASVRAYVVESLRDLGYAVVAAGSGDEALALLSAPQTRVDLLLSDVILPGRNGAEIAAAARQLRPSLRVLFMTGYSRDAIVHEGRLDAGVVLIQKPFSQTQLATRLREVMEG
jgi:signal transduction histidine kinase